MLLTRRATQRYILNMTIPEHPYKQGLLIPVSRLKTPVVNKTIILFIPSGSGALIIHVSTPVKRQLDIPPQNSP